MENLLINYVECLDKLTSKIEINTNFSKNSSKSKIEYSKNFVNFQKNGRFSVQTQR